MNKWLILSLLCALSVPTLTLAAENDDPEAPSVSARTRYYEERESPFARIIPQASLIVSTLTGTDATDAQNKTGFGVGVLTDIGRSDFTFETGLLYRQLGATANSDGVTLTISLNYLSLPLSGKYYFSGQNNNSMYMKIGIVPSFLISKDATFSDGSTSVSTSKLNVNSFDLGAMGGLGGKIAVGPTTDMLIEATYMRGLTKVSSSDLESYNSGVTVSAGIGINL